MSAPILRGRVHAIVQPDGSETAESVAALWDSAIPSGDVVGVVVADDLGADATNRLALVPGVDYLVVARASTHIEDGWLADAVALLRSDGATGLVGWSAAGRARGELDLFGCHQAFVIRHSAFHAVGGLDPEVPSILADVNLGWRLWLAGYRVRSLGPLPEGEHRAIEDDVAARQGLRVLLGALLDSSSLGPEWGSVEGRAAKRLGAAQRYRIQSTRRRGDGEMLPLVHESIRRWAAIEPSAASLLPELERFGAPDRAGARRRIAVVTTDTLAKRMAGPGIRAAQIARRLGQEHDVVLASTGLCELDVPGVEVRQVGEHSLRALETWCDVFIFQGWVLTGRPYISQGHKVVIADIYDPMHLEQLEQAHDAPGEHGRRESVTNTVHVLNEQLSRADFLLCASDKQRDFWLGQLAAVNRINPVTYDGDESLRGLLAVVPFGVGDEAPVQTTSGIRGAMAGIAPTDKVILWGGGVYNWFDPLTLVSAVHRLSARVPDVRLVFLGMKHPNPGVPQMEMAFRTQQLAQELGIEGTHVFFNREWVEFDQRQNFLCDADIGVSTHLDHIETEFSFRTRILDYLWAELPIVATEGDSFATLIQREGLGEVVPARDVDALELALERLLTDPEAAERCRSNIRRISHDLRWEACLRPLVEFCRNPHRAADVACPDLDHGAVPSRLSSGRKRDVQIALSYLRAGAPGPVVKRVFNRIRARVT